MSQAAAARKADGEPAGAGGAGAADAPDLLMLSQTGPRSFTRSEIEDIELLLPYLSYSGGRLAAHGTPLMDLWDGRRPLLLYVPDRAVDNYRSIQTAFGRHFDVSIRCAIKACYVGGVLSALRAAGAGVEVSSELEWRIAQRVGFPPNLTVVNGMCRPAAHLQRLVSEDGLLIDVDSEEELEHIEWEAQRQGVRPKIMVRVNPLAPDAFFSERSKLGVGADEASRLLEQVARSTHLDLNGLHAHQLVRCANPEQFALLAQRMGEIRDEFTATNGTSLETLDLGGGIEARYLLERAGHTIDDFADAARDALGGAGQLHLVLEPGRYIFGDAALVLTGVMGTKRKSGHDWLIAEVGCNLLPPTSDRAYPALPLRFEDEQTWKRWHVADPTPAPSRLCLDAMLPSGAVADGIALIGCGAYTAVRASLWSTDLPEIGLLEDAGVEMVFDRAGQDMAFRALYGIDLADADWSTR